MLPSCDAITQHKPRSRVVQNFPVNTHKCTICRSLFLKQKIIYAPKREFSITVQPFVTHSWVESTWRSQRISHGVILLGKTLSGTKSILDLCHAVQGRSNRLVFASAKQPWLILMAVLPWCTKPTRGTAKCKSPLFCSWTSINIGPEVCPQRLFPSHAHPE